MAAEWRGYVLQQQMLPSAGVPLSVELSKAEPDYTTYGIAAL